MDWGFPLRVAMVFAGATGIFGSVVLYRNARSSGARAAGGGVLVAVALFTLTVSNSTSA